MARCLRVGLAERAKDLKQKPVYVHALRKGLGRQAHGMINYWSEDPLAGASWTAARRLFADSDFAPGDLDVAQIYDAFTPLIPLSLEGTVFAAEAKARRSPTTATSISAGASRSTLPAAD
jgi:hypothetical protein